jgi:hypothetical protein
MQVGAPGAPTNGIAGVAVDRDWTDGLLRMYNDVALCREELAGARPSADDARQCALRADGVGRVRRSQPAARQR